MFRRATSLVLLASTVLTPACVKYRARPLDPPALEAQLRSRTLDDTGLRDFVRQHAKIASWPPRPLDLEALALAAEYYSPEMEIARAEVAAARAALTTARARPDLALDLEAGYNTGPESHRLYSVLPQFTIETAGKRGLRILQAERELEAAQTGAEEATWRVRRAVGRAYYEHLFARKKLDIAEAEDRIQAEIVAMFERRLEVGEAARPELDSQRVARLRAQAELRLAEGEAARTQVVLASAAGLPARALEGFGLRTDALESLPSEQQLPLDRVLQTGLLHRADIRRQLAEYAAADVRLRLEVARQYPDVHLSPGYVFEEGFARYMLNPSLPFVPLPHRNKGPIAQAEAQREILAARFGALQAKAIAEMDEALAQYRSALASFATADTALIAAQRDRERAAARALEAGLGDRLSLANARLETAAAGRSRLEVLIRARAALGALEDAVQHPLESTVPR